MTVITDFLYVEKLNIISASNIEEFQDIMYYLNSSPVPDKNELIILTNAGGPGVMATDALLVILTPQAMTECLPTAEAVVRVVKKKPHKTVLACFLGAEKIAESLGVLRAGGIPQYRSPESAVDVIKVMSEHVRWRTKPKRVVRLFPVNRHKVEIVIERHIRQGREALGRREYDRATQLADQARNAVMKVLPDFLNEEMKRARNKLLDLKVKGGDLTRPIGILKQASIHLKREEYGDAMRFVRMFRRETEAL